MNLYTLILHTLFAVAVHGGRSKTKIRNAARRLVAKHQGHKPSRNQHSELDRNDDALTAESDRDDGAMVPSPLRTSSQGGAGMMTLFVQMGRSTPVAVDVPSDGTVADVVARVPGYAGRGPLSVCGRRLDGAMLLADAGVCAETMLCIETPVVTVSVTGYPDGEQVTTVRFECKLEVDASSFAQFMQDLRSQVVNAYNLSTDEVRMNFPGPSFVDYLHRHIADVPAYDDVRRQMIPEGTSHLPSRFIHVSE